jgi:transketolase C-terminal domain/subunit
MELHLISMRYSHPDASYPVKNWKNFAGKHSNFGVLTAGYRRFFQEHIKKLYRERYVDVGIAEQNLMAIAAGLALGWHSLLLSQE